MYLATGVVGIFIVTIHLSSFMIFSLVVLGTLFTGHRGEGEWRGSVAQAGPQRSNQSQISFEDLAGRLHPGVSSSVVGSLRTAQKPPQPEHPTGPGPSKTWGVKDGECQQAGLALPRVSSACSPDGEFLPPMWRAVAGHCGDGVHHCQLQCPVEGTLGRRRTKVAEAKAAAIAQETQRRVQGQQGGERSRCQRRGQGIQRERCWRSSRQEGPGSGVATCWARGTLDPAAQDTSGARESTVPGPSPTGHPTGNIGGIFQYVAAGCATARCVAAGEQRDQRHQGKAQGGDRAGQGPAVIVQDPEPEGSVPASLAAVCRPVGDASGQPGPGAGSRAERVRPGRALVVPGGTLGYATAGQVDQLGSRELRDCRTVRGGRGDGGHGDRGRAEASDGYRGQSAGGEEDGYSPCGPPEVVRGGASAAREPRRIADTSEAGRSIWQGRQGRRASRGGQGQKWWRNAALWAAAPWWGPYLSPRVTYGPIELPRRVEQYPIEADPTYVGPGEAALLGIMRQFSVAVETCTEEVVHSLWYDPREAPDEFFGRISYDAALQRAKMQTGLSEQRVACLTKHEVRAGTGTGPSGALGNAWALETACVSTFPDPGPNMDSIERRGTNREQALFNCTRFATVDGETPTLRPMYSCTKGDGDELRSCLHRSRHALPLKVSFTVESSQRWLNGWTRLLPSWQDLSKGLSRPCQHPHIQHVRAVPSTSPCPRSQDVQVLPSTPNRPSQVAEVSRSFSSGEYQHGRFLCPQSLNVQVCPSTSRGPSQVSQACATLQLHDSCPSSQDVQLLPSTPIRPSQAAEVPSSSTAEEYQQRRLLRPQSLKVQVYPDTSHRPSQVSKVRAALQTSASRPQSQKVQARPSTSLNPSQASCPQMQTVHDATPRPLVSPSPSSHSSSETGPTAGQVAQPGAPLTVPRDPPALLGREGPARPSELSKLGLKRIEVLPEHLARYPVNEIPIDQLGLFALEPSPARRVLKYSVFDRQRHHHQRTAAYGWSLSDLVSEAVRAADERIRVVQVLTSQLPNLATPQLVLTPEDAGPGQLCVPIDLRPLGGRPCTMLLQPGTPATDVISVALRHCPSGPMFAPPHDDGRQLFLVDAGGNVWDELPPDLAQLQWLQILCRQPFDIIHDEMQIGPAMQAQPGGTTASTTWMMEQQQVQMVSFILAGLGITVRLHPQHVSQARVPDSIADLVMAIARQRQLPQRARVVLAAAQPMPLQISHVAVIFILFPEDGRKHIILDPSGDGSMAQSISVDDRTRPEELVSEAQRRQRFVVTVNGITQAAVRRGVNTGDYVQVVQNPRRHRVSPTDWYYQLYPQLRLFAFPVEVPRLQRATMHPLNSLLQTQVRDGFLRYLAARLEQQEAIMGRPAADRQAVIVQGPDHAPALVYVPGRIVPVLAEVETALIATGLFPAGTAFADSCQLTHSHAPLFLSIPPHERNLGIFVPAPGFFMGYHLMWVAPGTDPAPLELPVHARFTLIYPGTLAQAATVRHQRVTAPAARSPSSLSEGTSLVQLPDYASKERKRCRALIQAHGLPEACKCQGGVPVCPMEDGADVEHAVGVPVPRVGLSRSTIPTPLGRRAIRSARVVPISLEQCVPPVAPAPVQTREGSLLFPVPRDAVQLAFAGLTLDAYRVAVPDRSQLHKAARWLLEGLDTHDRRRRPDALMFFVDGSFAASHTSWAVACLALVDGSWGWWGYLADVLDERLCTGDAFAGELFGQLVACCTIAHEHLPATVFFDCESAARIMLGRTDKCAATPLRRAALAVTAFLEVIYRADLCSRMYVPIRVIQEMSSSMALPKQRFVIVLLGPLVPNRILLTLCWKVPLIGFGPFRFPKAAVPCLDSGMTWPPSHRTLSRILSVSNSRCSGPRKCTG